MTGVPILEPEVYAPFFECEHRDIYNKTRETLWLARRYEEINLFQHLQRSANKLDSMSPNELLVVQRQFLEVLNMGWYDCCISINKLTLHVSNNEYAFTIH
jgi:hypothetical protein